MTTSFNRFVCFRFFLVPADEHLFTQPASSEAKMGWFASDFLRRRDDSRGGIEYALRIGERRNHLVTGKLSRKKIYELHEKSEHDIRERKVEDWPYLRFICDVDPTSQLLVIEENTSVIRTIEDTGKILTRMANDALFVHGYATAFEPIVSPQAFWSVVAASARMYSLTFKLRSPNFFGASSDANRALKELQAIFNNTEADFTISNEKGNLVVPQTPEIESYRDYADRGGGSWSLSWGPEKGRRRRTKSSDRAIRITIESTESTDSLEILMDALSRFKERL